MHRMELKERGVESLEKPKDAGVRKFINMVKGNEHPDLANKPQHDLTDEEKRRLKHVTPKSLSSEDALMLR